MLDQLPLKSQVDFDSSEHSQQDQSRLVIEFPSPTLFKRDREPSKTPTDQEASQKTIIRNATEEKSSSPFNLPGP